MARPNKMIVLFLAVLIGVFSFVYVKVYVKGEHHAPAAATAPPPVSAAFETWIVGRTAIARMLHDGASPALIKRAFYNNHTFVYGDSPATRYPPSPFGVPTITFSSYQGIVQAFADGLLPRGFKAVLYDNEYWRGTPVAEQRHPVQYMAMAGHLLHSHGLLYIAAPAPDLMAAVGRSSDSYASFLDAGIPAAAARYADVLDLQGQVREDNVDAYSTWVRLAAAQARAANPRIKVLVGIGTHPGDKTMFADYRATASVGEGYWVNVVNGFAAPAVYLLRRIYNTH